jgi:hypothetical protein
MPPRARLPWLLVSCGFALAAGTIGASCNTPPVSIQAPREAQLVDDPSVVVSARVLSALDETSGALRVDGVDLLAALGVVPPFTGVAGVVQIGGVPVQISELDWATAPGGPDDVSVRLTGLAPGAHLVKLEASYPGPGELRSATRGFTVSGPLALALESWDAGGLAAGAQALTGGEASAASLGAAHAGGEIPFASGDSLHEGLPAAAAALGGTP